MAKDPIEEHLEQQAKFIITAAKTEEERDHEIALAKAQRPYNWAYAAGKWAEALIFVVFWICLFQHCSGRILPW